VTVDRSRLPALVDDRAFRFPAVARAAVPAGPRLRVVEHHDLPVLALLLVLPVGAADDGPGRAGLAAFTADLLDEGTGELSAIDVHEALARIGAQLDVDTGYDATLVTLVTLAKHQQRALSLLADIVFRPRLAAEDVERVRTLRVNRLRQLATVPAALADVALARELFGAGPYGHLAIGTTASIEGLGEDEARAFHARHYHPSRATLVAAGDVDPDALIALATEAFGAVGRPADASGDAGDTWGGAPGQPDAPPRVVLIDRPAAAQSEVRVGCVAASRDTADYHALLVLNAALGGQFVSRLNLNLRERRGVTYGARSGFEMRRRPGPFVVQASVQTNATAESVYEMLDEARGVRGDRPLTPREIAVAHATLTRGYARSFETADQLARAVAQQVVYGLPDEYYDRFPGAVRAVDESAATAAAQRWIDPSRMSIVIVGDRDAVAAPLEALGRGPVAVGDAEV
jgi:zinc protease